MSKNPFAVLGFAPTAFAKLTDDQIKELVRDMYRAAAKLFHPDRNVGDKAAEERFKEIQDAHDALENESDFAYWLQYFRPRKRKDAQAVAEEERDAALREAANVRGALVDCWIAKARGQEVVYHAYPGLTEPRRRKFGADKVSVFAHPRLRLLMTDQMEVLLAKRHISERGGDPLWETMDHFGDHYELYVARDGTLRRQDLKEVEFNPKKDPMPQVSEDRIFLRRDPGRPSVCLRSVGRPKQLDGVQLVGSIRKLYLNARYIRQEHPETELAGLLPTDVRPEDFHKLHGGYGLQEFAPYLRFVTPAIMQDQLLVACTLPAGEVRFSILGSVFRIFPR